MTVLTRKSMVAEMNASVIQNAIELRDPTLARKALREIDLLLGSSALDPNERVYLLFSKSSCYGILGNFEKAREQLSLALQQQPEDPDTRLTFELNGGLLCQQEGNYHEALERFTAVLSGQAQRLNRPELRFIYEDIQQRRAFLSVTLRQFQDAIPLLREILFFDLEKNVRSDALASLGHCYLELREWELAKDYFLQAKAIGVTKEREKTFHFYLGIAYFYTEALAEAKREFEICEAHAGEYQLPTFDLYGWLSSVSKRLGETVESERYARLARPS
jgi:tetratricopeptide (TPR) repeat protein